MPITLPYIFTNGQIADAAQVNANFSALATDSMPLSGGTITGQLSLAGAGVGGPWLIQRIAGANPANPWHLMFSQDGTEVLTLHRSGGGGIAVPNFYSTVAVSPENPQVAPLEIDPLAIWGASTGFNAMRSTGNRSDGIIGVYGGSGLSVIAQGGGFLQVGGYNGTAAAPTMPVSNNLLGSIVATGYRGDNWATMPWVAWIGFNAAENWTAAVRGADIRLHTTPNGTSAQQVSATVEHNGNFTIVGATATKPGSTAWVNPSDPRLKSHVEPYETGLDQLVRLNPIRYRYNGTGPLRGYTGEHVGLDADHVAEVMPSLHGTMKHEGESYGTVDSGELIFTLLNAVKELAAEMAELKRGSQ